MQQLGIDIRAGLHTGEIEVAGGKVRGIAVHTGARIASAAQPGEILVSSTVKDLVSGSGLEFADRGMHALKDIPGRGSCLPPATFPEVTRAPDTAMVPGPDAEPLLLGAPLRQ